MKKRSKSPRGIHLFLLRRWFIIKRLKLWRGGCFGQFHRTGKPNFHPDLVKSPGDRFGQLWSTDEPN